MGIEVAFSEGWARLSGWESDEALDEPVEGRIERSEVGGGHGDEDHGDRGGPGSGVSRSGHWTRLSSAQQEMKKPMNPAALARLRGLRWRLAALGGLLGPALALLLLGPAGAAADLVVGRSLGDRTLVRLPDVRSRRCRRAKPAALLPSWAAPRRSRRHRSRAGRSARRGSRPPPRARPRSRRHSPAPECAPGRESPRRASARPPSRRAPRAPAARPSAALGSSPSLTRVRRSAVSL